ncbi:MAG: cytochrome c biogenesis protein CcdA, partial [Elusimicrobia bacterium]|nr:cytochrome c biogenesis protein CcdA [Elusimicrobiota bacterium]
MAVTLDIPTAFAAGVVSFLSPCVLPLVPGYLSFMSGMSLEELSRGAGRAEVLRRAGVGSLFFVLGFALVFTLLGASASEAGQLLAAHMAVLTRVAGVVIILVGLHVSGILPIPFLYYEKRASSSRLPPGYWGSFAMGLAFAFGWTPCIGPILAGILALAAAEGTVARGALLLAAYSLGLGVPFILTGFGLNAFLSFFARYKRHIVWGERAAGLLLIGVGALVFS